MPWKIRNPSSRGAADAVLHSSEKSRALDRAPGGHDRRHGRPVRRRGLEPALDGHHRRHDRARGAHRRRRRPGLHRRWVLTERGGRPGALHLLDQRDRRDRSAGPTSMAPAPTRAFIGGITGSPFGLAVDESHIYWTIPLTNRIGRAETSTERRSLRPFSATGPASASQRDRGDQSRSSLLDQRDDRDTIGQSNLDGSAPDASFMSAGSRRKQPVRARGGRRPPLLDERRHGQQSPGPISTAPGWTSPSCRPPPRCAGSPWAGAGSSGATRRAGRSGGRTSTAAVSSPAS